MQKRTIKVTIQIEQEFPDKWDDSDIDFYLNESSYCLGNTLEKINEYALDHNGCICAIAHAEVVSRKESEAKP